jgi:hypothetical protein
MPTYRTAAIHGAELEETMATNIGFDRGHPYVLEGADEGEISMVGDRLAVTRIADPGPAQTYSVGARIPLTLADRFHAVDRARFPIPTAPTDLTSVQRELSRLTGLPVQTTIPDAPIPRSVTYEENRLDAVEALASVLGAFAYVTPDGSLGLAPKQPGPVVAHLAGTVIDAAPSGMSDDDVYNQVVVTTHDDDQTGILATASITDGPLRVDGPFMARPYKASSPYVTTRQQAQDYANTLLPQVSRLKAVTWTVQIIPDPRLEVWDTIQVDTHTGTITGRVSKITMTDDTMILEVQVI